MGVTPFKSFANQKSTNRRYSYNAKITGLALGYDYQVNNSTIRRFITWLLST
ncbi:MAG: hypothetical protein AB8U25_03035 [Rickettsiales endosymbiont of Dermacentor nuttalli]